MGSDHSTPSAERWTQIQRVFDTLAELPIDERAARLDTACDGDPELHRIVGSLLVAHDRSDAVLHALEHPEAAGARAPDPDRLVGRTISHYRVVERLGGGGMGVVYRAEDERLGRSVALKFLPPFRSGDPEVQRRFVQEAQAASALDHPNICPVYETGESADGGLFIAMAYYPGESLKDAIARGPVPRDAVLWYATQVARGLAAVHREGIIHRDIKPANLLRTPDDTIKILDFGLAKVADVTLTQAGRTMGTVAYMSPEQVRAEDLDARTDLWSLGVVLYEMLGGRRPFRGEQEPSVIYAILNTEPAPLGAPQAEGHGPLERVVRKLLRKDPGERYRDADALLVDLEAIREGREPPIVARDLPPAPARGRRRRVAWAAGVLLVFTAAIWGARPRSPGGTPPATDIRLSTIAVFPFSLKGDSDLVFLGEGMVDLLSLKIDATARFRSVTPRVLLDHVERLPPEDRDPEKVHHNVPDGGWAADMADRFLAEYFVVGTVTGAGGRVELAATMYTPRRWEPVVVTTVTASRHADLIGAIDELADRLITSIPGTGVRHEGPSLAALTTASLPALRAYLAGRRADRRFDVGGTNAHMRRALELDSTFALAWFNLALLREFYGEGTELEHAELLGKDLSPRQRDHLSAFRAQLEGRAPDAERLYRRLLARYPDDVEAWRMLGEVLFVYGGFYGRSMTDARRVFERVVALDPNLERASYRLLEIAAFEGNIRAFDSIAMHVAGFSPPESEDARLYRLLPRLTGATAADRRALQAELEGSATPSLLSGIDYYATSLGDVATLRWLNDAKIDPINPPGVQDRAHYRLALLEAARGRFGAAERHLAALGEFNPGWALVLRASIAALPHAPDSAAPLVALRRRVAAWDTLSPPLSADTHIGSWADLTAFLQGLLSFRLGDEAALRTVAGDLAERGAAQDRGIPGRQLASTLTALDAWRRGEAERALTALADAVVDLPLRLRDSPLHPQALTRYVRGEVLYSLGRYEDALPWFASLNPAVNDGFSWLYFAPAQLRLAEIQERLGHIEEATRHYHRFLELWRNCDPPLRPRVEEATRRLAELTSPVAVTAH